MKRFVFSSLCALLALLTLNACAKAETAENGVPVYYLVNENGFERLEKQFIGAPEDTSGLLAFVVTALTSPGTAGAQNAGGPAGAVPQGVQMVVNLSGAGALVDFGGAFGELSQPRKSMIIAAVALSLLEIDGVSYIYVTVEGEHSPPFYDRAMTAGSFVTEQTAHEILGRQ